MRISWLEPQVIGIARDVLIAHGGTWNAMFDPELSVPPAPTLVDAHDWPLIAEHVARAERVSSVVREHGLHVATSAFGTSPFAVEHATLIAASTQVDRVTLDQFEALLACKVDVLVLYGQFLAMLCDIGVKTDVARSIAAYERFCLAVGQVSTAAQMWPDRVGAVSDGLASFYITCGQLDKGHAIFIARHAEQTTDLVVALAASRSFLSVKAIARAMEWLGIAAERADVLGRAKMRDRLLAKQTALRARLGPLD